jgi:hypothetical protein
LAPIAKEPAPAAKESPPAAKETVPAVEQSVPTAQELAPIAKEPAPAAKESPPAAKETVPAVEQSVPTAQELAPIAKEPAPAAKESAPAAKETVSPAKETAPAVEEPAPEAVKSVPGAEAQSPAVEEPAPKARPSLLEVIAIRRHAQPSAGRPETRKAVGLACLAVVATALLLGGGWWMLFGGPSHPQARYLPDDCDLFLALKWKELADSGAPLTCKDAPGLSVAEQCTTFLNNAGLSAADVEQINVGRAADGSGVVFVYRLARPVQPEDIMKRSAFRGKRKSPLSAQETVGGIPLYVPRSLAVAFPEPQVVVLGQIDLLRRTLGRRRHGFRGRLGRLVQDLDWSSAVSVAAAGVPGPLADAYLRGAGGPSGSLDGTTDEFRYGPTLRFARTFHLGKGSSPGEIQESLKTALAEAVNNPRTPAAARPVLSSIEVTAGEGKVRVETTLSADRFSADVVKSLSPLFQTL